MTSSRRPSTRRSTSLYSRPIQEPPKVYDQTSDDLDSDASAPFEEDDEETLKLEDAAYHSEEEEMDEEQEDMMEEEDEEEEEEEEMEGDDEEMEGDDEEEMEGDDEEEMEEEPDEEEPEEDIEEQLEEDIDVEVEELEDADATPVDDEEDEFAVEDSDEDEEEEEDEDDEQSDYEEEMSSRRTRGGTIHRSQSQSSMKPEEQSISRKRGSITETSSSSHGNRILTKRQRAKLNENYQQDLLQLPMEPMKKKHMTEEEIALKKSEIARRRKHQSIQRAEQDKMETINRLLKKQSTKKRMRDQDETDSVQNESNNNNSLPPSSYHYVNNVESSTFSIPIGVDILTQFEKGPKYPPPVPNCAFPGCNVPKKYCSVKTLKYACSMDHLHKLESKG